MARRSVSNQDRQRLVDCYEAGDDFINLAEQLGVNRDTARSVIRVWLNEGRVEAKARGGARNQRVDGEMVQEILRLARDNPFTTLENIKDHLRRNLPMKPVIHTSTIARHLNNQLISLKIAGKDSDVPHQRNLPANKEKRWQYAQWLTQLPATAHIIYVDECGFNIYQRRRQGRAEVGQRVRRQVNGARGRNINLIMAISADHGLLYHELKQETLNRERYVLVCLRVFFSN